MSKKLKDLCWQYIDTISNKQIRTEEQDRKRSELHSKILDESGLSYFEFGGIPFWYEIEDVDTTTTRLYEALLKQIINKNNAQSLAD